TRREETRMEKLGDYLEKLYSFVERRGLPIPDLVNEEFLSVETLASFPVGWGELIQRVAAGYYEEDNPIHLYILFCLKEYPKLIEGLLRRQLPPTDEFPILKKLVQLL
ncbi:MAG: hypothetical protein QW687_04030, partial [Candidatus Hadarchaeales archaeon]